VGADINPNSITLYAGLSGVEYTSESVELSNGIQISDTYAHLMSPRLLAFNEPEEDEGPHPGPWEAVRGGRGHNVRAQAKIPESIRIAPFDHLNSVWWFVAMLRLKGTNSLYVPVVSDRPFQSVPELEDKPFLWSVEEGNTRVAFNVDENPTLAVEDIRWVEEHWGALSKLSTNGDFRTAVEALEGSMKIGDPNLALVLLWGGLQRIFSGTRGFRLSAYTASYLRPLGDERYKIQKRMREFHDARAKAAHGSQPNDYGLVADMHRVLTEVLLKVVECGETPDIAFLKANLFGVTNSDS